jgi:hypothetical protein
MALLDPQFDDIEAEITYLLIRASHPKTLVEVSPAGVGQRGGFSTIKDNDSGTPYSYDLVDDSLKTLPSDLLSLKWVLKEGDVKKTLVKCLMKLTTY